MSEKQGKIWHFLPKSDEEYLQARVKAGQSTLLVTGRDKSFVLDLDWSGLYGSENISDSDDLDSFPKWAKMMTLYVDRKLTQELLAGAQDFVRHSREWLQPHQRNYALFFLGADGDDVVFNPIPATV